MSNKTISINPSLFSMGGSKTKKNREKKQKSTIVPLISPNVLKNKLLKRIKEHKQRETENLENNRKKLPTPEESMKNDIVKPDLLSSFSDEFSDSINYLQTLSKQKKVNDEKLNYERQKQKRKEQIERKTVRNHHQPHIEHNVNLDLPEELMTRPLIVVNTDTMSTSGQPIQLHTKTHDTIPYGILKGGSKPTYKDWARTQRNYDVTNPQAALTIQGLELNKEKNERENRLNNLREKLKQKQIEETINKSEDIMLTQKPIIDFSEKRVENIVSQPLQNDVPINVGGGGEIIATKKITKKTIKRKYTLGRSKNKRTVSILVKDRGTRKIILGAQKDLKRKSINDVREYLRDHNLIKIGSNAPNDVLRKLYESAMLAGEITNSNSEILLHNFSKDDKEL
jgi:hypothetical protein